MLEQYLSETKQQYLTQIVLEGVCPNCHSNNVKFYDFLQKTLFGFKCKACGWKDSYTAGEFQEISSGWDTQIT
jgi:hypothetical protein